MCEGRELPAYEAASEFITRTAGELDDLLGNIGGEKGSLHTLEKLEQAEENMKVSGKQYEVGLETLSDYLEAQMLWQQAYQTRVDAHFQLYVNYIAYLKAAGQLHPTD